jgi:hypothetical protein
MHGRDLGAIGASRGDRQAQQEQGRDAAEEIAKSKDDQ